jgi:membrane fusion protein, heavy metal efflux system
MSANGGLTLSWTTAVVVIAGLLAVGSGATYWAMRERATARTSEPDGANVATGVTDHSHSGAASMPGPSSDMTGGDIVVTLGPDAIERAGITVATVASGHGSSELRLPGVVEPNIYRQVEVTPIVAGRITSVQAELGQHVRHGDTLAEVLSPELAEAHTRYTAARAELAAHERELRRSEQLVEIGAASRQELERLIGEHTAKSADVQSTRTRLELFGVPAEVLDNWESESMRQIATVSAPMDGVITERRANIGLNIDAASRLFTIVDYSTVWVVADLYEPDFGRVRVGSRATVTAAGTPEGGYRGLVSYLDPQVNPQTRTAKLRIEVPNPKGLLRLGMYADVRVAVDGAAGEMAMVPRSAVQTMGDRFVVYLADPQQPGRFTEREVRLGSASGQDVEVVTGLRAGETVVTEGSFLLRAERERTGIVRSVASPAAQVLPKSTAAKPALDITLTQPAPTGVKAGVNQFEVMVTGADGKPPDNADVSLIFVMPPMGTMAEMKNEIKLKAAGAGKYTGSGNVMIAGKWNVTISVKQQGKEVGQTTLTLTAK